MGILTNIRNAIQRKNIAEGEKLLNQDLLNKNRDKLEDISQRRGLVINSGLSIAERDYILSDAMIASAIQLYLADILSICSKDSVIISSNIDIKDEDGEAAKKLERVKNIFNQVYSDKITEAIGLNLINNGEIFLETSYNKGLNKATVNETSFSRCTQLCFSSGKVATYVCSNTPYNENNKNFSNYAYNLNSSQENTVFLPPEKMVRIYNPTLVNSKVCIELDNEEDKELKQIVNNNFVYYTGSQSLLKQVYPDWLNSKLLELAVYRDRIAKSRFIHLISLELGRTSRITSDQIYDNVKDYFDKRAVIDLEQQTFKSVVGDEPFTDYKVYTTRNGVGQLSFDNSLASGDNNISSLADLDYNLTKVFAGLGIPKQYLGADDNGSALSNGGSLFFMDEKYQKRIVAYVKREANGWKDIIKNIIIQQEENNNEFFLNWDFNLEFEIPENNEDTYRVKNAKLDYANALIELANTVNEANSAGKQISIDYVNSLIQEDLRSLIKDLN